MNLFILLDLEGIPGVTDIGYMDREGEKYQDACRYLTRSMNVAAEAAFSAGVDKVYYLDGHGGGGNIIVEEVDRRAVKCDINKWQDLIISGEIDFQIDLGSHARAGTIAGFLDHTFSSKEFFAYRVNGIEMSEYSIHALFCSEHGVPIIACIGDEVACRQAREYNPTVYTGAVKIAKIRNKATDYANGYEIIKDTVIEAIKNYKSVKLYNLESPYTVQLTYYRTDMCDGVMARASENVTRVDARTVSKTLEKINTYWDVTRF